MNLIRRTANMVKRLLPDSLKRSLVPGHLQKQLQVYLTDFSKRPPVLVYSMGKVGSTSIVEAIQRAELPYTVFKLHALEARRLDAARKEHAQQGQLYNPRAYHLWVGKALRHRLHEPLAEKWRVITGMREPISLTVSRFFQIADARYPEVLDAEGRIRENKALEYLQKQIEHFDEHPNYACTWFDKELKAVFGVDLYAVPFDHEAGYTIVERPDVKVLAYRVEDLERCFVPALRAFFNLTAPIEPVKANRGRKKAYHEVYERVKRQLSFSEDVLSRIYSTRYVQHFYEDEMIEKFKRRWSK